MKFVFVACLRNRAASYVLSTTGMSILYARLLPSLLAIGIVGSSFARADDSDSFAVRQYSRVRDKYLGTALRTPSYRFVRWVETESGRIVHRELYDHNADPGDRD